MPSDFWDWSDSFRGLVFTGIEDIRRGITGGCWLSNADRDGLLCLRPGRDGPAAVEGRAALRVREADAE